MTLKQFLSSCQLYVEVSVYSPSDLIVSDTCCFILNCSDKSITDVFDCTIDYITVVDGRLIVVLF